MRIRPQTVTLGSRKTGGSGRLSARSTGVFRKASDLGASWESGARTLRLGHCLGTQGARMGMRTQKCKKPSGGA